MSLAELPDLRPHRALQLLPPVADASVADGAAGWVRRFFAPALTAGAALAMVGLVGTAVPALDGMAAGGSIFSNVGTNLDGAAPGAEADGASRGNEEPAASDAGLAPAEGGEGSVTAQESGPDHFEGLETVDGYLPAERSPWPMVLFTGVALMIGAALLRWIVVPRAG
jgi:hypothetical protein